MQSFKNKNNDKYIDLHMHSTASDGSMTPEELVKHSYRLGLAAIALTDHDTVEGVRPALEEGERLGMEVIPGVEISVSLSSWDLLLYACQHGRNGENFGTSSEPEMHLLGYFFNGGYELLSETLDKLRQKREHRNPRIIEKLKELGINITLQEVVDLATGGVVGRPHIARVLVKKGYTSSISEAFDKYLAVGRPAYFRKDKLTPQEGIAEIIRSGGIPVLAHPIYLDFKACQLGKIIDKLKVAGLKGIEALYSENTLEQTEELLKLAMEHNLKVTGGSDFHGSFKPDIEAGVGKGSLKVPYSLLSRLKEA